MGHIDAHQGHGIALPQIDGQVVAGHGDMVRQAFDIRDVRSLMPRSIWILSPSA